MRCTSSYRSVPECLSLVRFALVMIKTISMRSRNFICAPSRRLKIFVPSVLRSCCNVLIDLNISRPKTTATKIPTNTKVYKTTKHRNANVRRRAGYADTGDYWRSWYETASFEQDVADLFTELKPFYRQLHAFVRRRLKAQYGDSVFPSSGHIPAHLLGQSVDVIYLFIYLFTYLFIYGRFYSFNLFCFIPVGSITMYLEL